MLNFEPADNYDYAGLDAVERNSCVGCNRKGVAKYYVIPKILFVHLPTTVKQYNCHDILMLCPACRARASPAQLAHVVRNGCCHCLFDRRHSLSRRCHSLSGHCHSLFGCGHCPRLYCQGRCQVGVRSNRKSGSRALKYP